MQSNRSMLTHDEKSNARFILDIEKKVFVTVVHVMFSNKQKVFLLARVRVSCLF